MDHKHIIFGLSIGSPVEKSTLTVIGGDGQLIAQHTITNNTYNDMLNAIMYYNSQHKPNVIWTDATSVGAVILEKLQMNGLPTRPFYVTSKSKSALDATLKSAIVSEALTLSDDTLVDMSLKLAVYGWINYGFRLDFS